jgi:hypothetical protein
MRADIKKKYELIDNPRVEGAKADVWCVGVLPTCRSLERQLRSSGALIVTNGYGWSPKKPLRACWQCVEAKFSDQDQTYLVTQRHLDREIKRNTPK